MIATRPASAPFTVMVKSCLPSMRQATMGELRTAAAHARFVVIATWAMAEGSTAIVLPVLNPNQPNHRIRPPRKTSPILWPGIGCMLPSGLYFPRRGPSIRMPARPDHPPTACTTVDPAKSRIFISASQPPPQIQCPVIG